MGSEPLDLDDIEKRLSAFGRVDGPTVRALVGALRSERANAKKLEELAEFHRGSAKSLAEKWIAAETRADAREIERDAYKRAKEENDERFMRERDEARAEVSRLKRLWVECGARFDHDVRCMAVSLSDRYPKPDAENCDCGYRELSLAMEAP